VSNFAIFQIKHTLLDSRNANYTDESNPKFPKSMLKWRSNH